jgi:hypothetical protein
MELCCARAEAVESFRDAYRTERYPRVVIPNAIDADAAAELRALAVDGLQPFYAADRGRYHVNTDLVDAPLFDSLRVFAERVVGTPLAVGPARWLRFARGDYQLLRGDAVERSERARHVELTLDFSATETKQAEIVYTDEAASFSEIFFLPQLPQSVALVERGDTLYRYDRYLNQHVGRAEVWRLRLALRFA